jgi:hypothetical protein
MSKISFLLVDNSVNLCEPVEGIIGFAHTPNHAAEGVGGGLSSGPARVVDLESVVANDGRADGLVKNSMVRNKSGLG